LNTLEELYKAVKGEESRLSKFIHLFDVSKLDISDFESFKRSLERYLNEKFRIEERLELLSSKSLPLNSVILSEILGVKKSEASLLLRMIKELGIIIELRAFKIVKSDEERIFLEILNRGLMKFSDILSKYKNAREIVLSLWKQKKIRIIDFEKVGISPEDIEDYDRIELDDVKIDRKFIEIWYDEFSGKEYGRLLIPINAKIMVNVDEIIRES